VVLSGRSSVAIPRVNPSNLSSDVDGFARGWGAKCLNKNQFGIEGDCARKIARVEIYHGGAEGRHRLPESEV
jgi:hypothetical protein